MRRIKALASIAGWIWLVMPAIGGILAVLYWSSASNATSRDRRVRANHRKDASQDVETPTSVPLDLLRVVNSDFGLVGVPSILTREFELANQSTNELHISDLRGRCPCVLVKPRSVSIPGGGKATLLVTADLTDQTVDATLPFAIELLYSTSLAPGRNHRLVLSGSLHTPIRPDKPVLYWDSTSLPALMYETHSVDLHFSQECVSLEVTEEHGQFLIQSKKVNPRQWTLSLTPTAQLRQGPFTEAVSVLGVLRDGSTVGPVNVLASGSLRSDYYAIPERLNPPVRFSDETIRATIALRSKSPELLLVDSVNSSESDVKVNWLDRQDEHGTTVELELRPMSAGARKFDIVVQGHDELTQRFTVRIPTILVTVKRSAR
jgi:hypothetical protein